MTFERNINRIRIARFAFGVIASSAILLTACGITPNLSPEVSDSNIARIRSLSTPTWTDVNDPTNVHHVSSILGATIDEHHAMSNSAAPSVQTLVEDARAAFDAIVSGNGAEYWDHALRRGWIFDRDMAWALAAQWRDWEILSHSSSGDVSDQSLFSILWNSEIERGMRIASVDCASLTAGSGLIVVAGRDDWPYSGYRGQLSCFMSLQGRLTRSEGTAIDGTPRSAHVSFRVRFENRAIGHVRLNYYYDLTSEMRFPLTIVVASESDQEWPWPLF